jgi:hypothetical protein
LAIDEHTGVFRLGHGSSDDRKSGGVGIDGGVEEKRVGGAELVVAPSYGLGIGAEEVGGVGLDAEGHFGGNNVLVGIRVLGSTP